MWKSQVNIKQTKNNILVLAVNLNKKSIYILYIKYIFIGKNNKSKISPAQDEQGNKSLRMNLVKIA